MIKRLSFTLSKYFYPQAPHGACQNKVSFQVPWDLISILRLRMEPVGVASLVDRVINDFYPQAPHGACLNDAMGIIDKGIFLSSGSAWSLSKFALLTVP